MPPQVFPTEKGSWSSKGTYSRVGERVSSLNTAVDRTISRSSYGTLPRSYGGSSYSSIKSSVPEPAKTYSRFSTRGYSVDRSLDRAKSPEPDKTYRRYSGYTPPETPALRLGSSSRFGGQIARSPISEKSPTVFGVSPISEKGSTPVCTNSSTAGPSVAAVNNAKAAENEEKELKVELCTRSTSPTPPCNSAFLRSRRADMERVLKSETVRSSVKPSVFSVETQTDDGRVSPLPLQRSTASSPSPTPAASSSWGSRVSTYSTPRYSSRVGGYSYSRSPDPPKTDSQQEKKIPSRPTDLPVRIPTSKTTESIKPEVKNATNVQKPPAVPNKDFRKSVLNMDLTCSQKTTSQLTKEENESSSDESSSSSSSSEDSDHEERKTTKDMPPKPPIKKDQETKSVLVKALNQAVPQKVKYTKIEEPPEKEEPKKPLVLRKFDSGDRAWWLNSNKDVPSLEKSEKENLSSEKSVSSKPLQRSSTSKNLKLANSKASLNSTSESPNNSLPKTPSSASLAGIKSIPNSPSNQSLNNSASVASIPNSASLEKLQSLPNSSSNISLEKPSLLPKSTSTPNNLSTATSPSNNSLKPGVSKSNSVSAVLKKSSSVEEKLSSSNNSLKKSTSSASFQNAVATVQKSPTATSIPSATCKSSAPKSDSKASCLEDSQQNISIKKNFSLRKFDSGELAFWEGVDESVVPNTRISPTKTSNSSENENASSKLSRTSSTKSLSKPPIKKSESRDSLNEPKEFTPGYHRIHAKKMAAVAAASAAAAATTEVASSAAEGTSAISEKQKSTSCSNRSSDSETGSTTSERMWPARKMIVRVESGERDWWLSDEEKQEKRKKKRSRDGPVYVGCFTNIDHVLGTQAPPPAAFRTPDNTSGDESDSCDDWCKKVPASQVKIHDSSAQNPVIQKGGMIKLDDTALQLYKDGDYGAYLDLDASINEQQEEFESFNSNRKNSIVLRTQLSVRVHTIIEKLLNSEGRDLRRALFSLKQIFQEDKDLVHEFVQNDGLACLIKVGSEADQNYQNYILRALGQVMLYVDGMNGVIDHPGTVQWLYNLVSSKFRLVVKTALKLLLVFVEYAETNCILLVKAIKAVDYVHTTRPWSNVMKLMKEYDAADTELLIYAMSLINKTLYGLPDQDMYYDQVDAIEEQGIESIIRRYMSKQGTDLDLLRQFQIYEAVLHHEDGEEKGTPLRQLDDTIRKALKNRKSLTATLNPVERRKSRRYSTGNSPLTLTLTPTRLITPPESPSDDILNAVNGIPNGTTNGHLENGVGEVDEESGLGVRRDASKVKDLSQKLAGALLGDNDKGPFGDMKGIISKAKEELAKSQARGDPLKSPSSDGIPPPPPRPPEVKKSETELHWESLKERSTRPLRLCDLDFCDLASDDDRDVLAPANVGGGVPPPPPPVMAGSGGAPPPAPGQPARPPPPVNKASQVVAPPAKKTKKTVKLFWKEVRDDPIVIAKMTPALLLWDEIRPVVIDTQKLEHLFESRAKDLITKEKQQEMNKNKEIIVLDHKRSNAINIGMTKLPPPRSIKTAILKMDATVMNREGIEKLLTMLPTEEERSKIQEAQAANPDLPLGSAEQFLLTLASISELSARLKLWAFKLDYENSEKEIAEPLMDLKQGMETLRVNRTFRAILSTLLSVGIFLNGSEVKGFQIEYLSKVPEVKDTVHKHTLLHHLCHMVMEKFPDATDLYSEIGAVTRASKVDFEELAGNIAKMEQECKASFDHLKIISKHDGATNMKLKMSDFLADCAERVIVLDKVHRRVVHRFHKFCLWLGIPLHRVNATKPNELCRTISEFALEYRTTRERVLQQLEKKASHRERNKTRGKMITEVGKFRSQDDSKDAELKQLLGNSTPEKETATLHGSLPWRRTKKDSTGRTVLGPVESPNGHLTDADDEIIESLVKTATKSPVSRTTPRERKRTRNADRKSLRRTLRNGLSEEERKHLAAYIKGY
ncbi:formin homology 2 domain containing isoform X4 [Rhodnius prolixus]|uniref:formin homology 2 domain containing isoform X4 n=1 Tax=Rhodnius prolixus TaxID=13249 RepID=UPI003D18ADFA